MSICHFIFQNLPLTSQSFSVLLMLLIFSVGMKYVFDGGDICYSATGTALEPDPAGIGHLYTVHDIIGSQNLLRSMTPAPALALHHLLFLGPQGHTSTASIRQGQERSLIRGPEKRAFPLK